jgi:hypothetical protein
MKTKNNRKICWACALLAAFVSCDGLNDGPGDGPKTAVHFSAGDLESWGAETPVRGASATPRLVETARVALEDNWVLEAGLIEEPAPATRAAFSGKIVMHVIARNSAGNAIVDEKDYVHQSNGNFQPVSTPIELNAGSYRFTAYSYNTTSAAPTTTTASVTFSPYNNGTATNDLILSSTASAVSITPSGGITLPTLQHQFSQVRYSTSSSGSVSMSSVSLTNNYTTTLTKAGATFAKAATNAQTLSTSYRIVYTNGNPPALNVSGTINGTPFSNVAVQYKTALAPGKSYTLQINVNRLLRWAGSNVYWDAPNSRLTFAPNGDRSKEASRGALFRWGSLVGISNFNGSSYSLSAEDSIYVPTYNPYANSTWVATGASWDYTYPPYIETGGFGDMNTDNLLAAADYYNKKGDICRYLSATGAAPAGYRMPTINELLYGHKDGNVPGAIGYSDENWYSATPTIVGYWSWNSTTGANYGGYATFPITGCRDESYGKMMYVYTHGFYWSSSASPMSGSYNNNVDRARAFFFYGSGMFMGEFYYRGDAYAVRCLLNE